MSHTKLFDLHIEVGVETGMYYAQSIFGNSVIFEQYHMNVDDAMYMLISELETNGVFNSLRKDPNLSQYKPPPSGTASVRQKLLTNRNRIFDLHVEVGSNTGSVPKTFYAKTELVNPPAMYNITSAYEMVVAVSDLVLELERKRVLDKLLCTPSMSIFPFGGYGSSSSSSSSTSSTPEPSVKKKDIVRELPSACIGYPDIQCRDHCTSWDCFGASKCKSMCSWRKKI